MPSEYIFRKRWSRVASVGAVSLAILLGAGCREDVVAVTETVDVREPEIVTVGTLRGVVVDEGGAPLDGASVSLPRPGGGEYVTATDSSGAWAFEAVAVADAVAEVSYASPDCHPVRMGLGLRPGREVYTRQRMLDLDLPVSGAGDEDLRAIRGNLSAAISSPSYAARDGAYAGPVHFGIAMVDPTGETVDAVPTPFVVGGGEAERQTFVPAAVYLVQAVGDAGEGLALTGGDLAVDATLGDGQALYHYRPGLGSWASVDVGSDFGFYAIGEATASVTLSGRLVDIADEPLAGASVIALAGLFGEVPVPFIEFAVTDGDGAWALPVPPGQIATLLFDGGACEGEQRSVDVGDVDVDIGDLAPSTTGSELVVTLVDCGGERLTADAEVTIAYPRGNRSVVAAVGGAVTVDNPACGSAAGFTVSAFVPSTGEFSDSVAFTGRDDAVELAVCDTVAAANGLTVVYAANGVTDTVTYVPALAAFLNGDYIVRAGALDADFTANCRLSQLETGEWVGSLYVPDPDLTLFDDSIAFTEVVVEGAELRATAEVELTVIDASDTGDALGVGTLVLVALIQ